jgi:hypothetical protein
MVKYQVTEYLFLFHFFYYNIYLCFIVMHLKYQVQKCFTEAIQEWYEYMVTKGSVEKVQSEAGETVLRHKEPETVINKKPPSLFLHQVVVPMCDELAWTRDCSCTNPNCIYVNPVKCYSFGELLVIR